MILFSPAKINIGLLVTGRRDDGYHRLQSVMHPIALYDVIEIMAAGDQVHGVSYTHSGIPTGSPPEKDLCVRACEMVARETPLPPIRLHLHKQIPVGAGLGGGSSNASTILRGLNTIAQEPLSGEKLMQLAESLGSDCPFFLHGGTMILEGRGEILRPVQIHLDHLWLVVLFPGIHISTAEAYRGVRPVMPDPHLSTRVQEPIEKWRDLIVNDFEAHIFRKHPVLKEIKEGLYGSGAVYASMSGSGSSLYGLFSRPPALPPTLDRLVIWKGEAGSATTPA